MMLYLDDDIAKSALASMLRRAHTVTLPIQVQMMGAADPRHLAYAVQQGLVLLTKNHNDFEDLHILVQAVQGRHAGILVVRSDNDPTRDMKDREIVRAIANLERAGVAITNEIHVRNQWR